MKFKKKIFLQVIFVVLFVVLVPAFVFSATVPKVKVYYNDGRTEIVYNFIIHSRYEFKKEASTYIIEYDEIKSIKVLGKDSVGYLLEATLSNGLKERIYWSSNNYDGSNRFGGETKYKDRTGDWEVMVREVSKIEFFFDTIETTGTSVVTGVKYDGVFLKNGDTLSGTVKTERFNLATSYGVFSFGKSEIESIKFEGGGQNIDIVVLKNGDKLSGVVQENTISFILDSGTKVSLEKDKVKDINFRK